MATWTINEVAKHINRDKQTVYGYVRDDKIPFIRRPTGAIEFDSDAIMQWWGGETQEKGENTQGQPIIGNEGQV